MWLRTPNQNANLPWTNAQQVAIVNSFISYLSNYSNWAESDPSFPATFRPEMVTIQQQMMSNVWGIFVNNKLWNADPLSTHYPTNSSACVNP